VRCGEVKYGIPEDCEADIDQEISTASSDPIGTDRRYYGTSILPFKWFKTGRAHRKE
jgi:hypothetical protein